MYDLLLLRSKEPVNATSDIRLNECTTVFEARDATQKLNFLSKTCKTIHNELRDRTFMDVRLNIGRMKSYDEDSRQLSYAALALFKKVHINAVFEAADEEDPIDERLEIFVSNLSDTVETLLGSPKMKKFSCIVRIRDLGAEFDKNMTAARKIANQTQKWRDLGTAARSETGWLKDQDRETIIEAQPRRELEYAARVVDLLKYQTA